MKASKEIEELISELREEIDVYEQLLDDRLNSIKTIETEIVKREKLIEKIYGKRKQ